MGSLSWSTAVIFRAPGFGAMALAALVAWTTHRARPGLRPSPTRGLAYVLAAVLLVAGIAWVGAVASFLEPAEIAPRAGEATSDRASPRPSVPRMITP